MITKQQLSRIKHKATEASPYNPAIPINAKTRHQWCDQVLDYTHEHAYDKGEDTNIVTVLCGISIRGGASVRQALYPLATTAPTSPMGV